MVPTYHFHQLLRGIGNLKQIQMLDTNGFLRNTMLEQGQ